MTNKLVSPPSAAAPVRPRHLADNATLSRRQPSPPPSSAKTQIVRRDITLPFAAAATDSTVAALARPPSQSEIEKSNQTWALH